VIEALYEAALQPEQLPDALHDFARLFNATVGLVIGIADHRGRLIISPDGKEGAAAVRLGREQAAEMIAQGADRIVADSRSGE
jgi:hypothetical protein